MSYIKDFRGLGAAPPLDKNGGTQTIDLIWAKQMIDKYGAILGYQVVKGVKTVAQADAELEAKIISRAAGGQASGIFNTIVNVVKSNWVLFAIGGLVLFGSRTF